MRKPGYAILAVVMVLAAIGCDSGGDGDNGLSDAEVFIGNWAVTSLLLNDQDFTALVLANTTVTVEFETAAFSLTITTDSTTTILGTYSVSESQSTITLTSSSFTNPITVNYTINTNNRISLETDDVALFTGLTGINPSDIGIMVEKIGLVVQRTGQLSRTFLNA